MGWSLAPCGKGSCAICPGPSPQGLGSRCPPVSLRAGPGPRGRGTVQPRDRVSTLLCVPGLGLVLFVQDSPLSWCPEGSLVPCLGHCRKDPGW